MDKIVINCKDGTREIVAMTAEEEAQRMAEIADALEADRAAYVEPEEPTAQVFDLPVIAPEFIVRSPKPKSDPAEALAHAQALALRTSKPLAEIVLNLMVVIADMEKRMK